jgi:hypothetical protein
LARPRRRRRGTATTEQAEVEQLRRQNEKLARDLARTQTALEIMGKAVCPACGDVSARVHSGY